MRYLRIALLGLLALVALALDGSPAAAQIWKPCNFNGDVFADLAIGAAGEDVGAIEDAGAVTVLYGSAAGLTGAGEQLWHEGMPGVTGSAEANDLFGHSLGDRRP